MVKPLQGIYFDKDPSQEAQESALNSSHFVANHSVLADMNDVMFRRLAPVIAVLAFLMAVGVAGNVAICYVFLRKLRRNSQNFMLLSLAVFDLVSCCVGIPSEIYDMRHYYLYNSEAACKFLRFLTTLPSLASVLILLVIAVDRFRKVCHPLREQLRLSHSRRILVVIVFIAIIFSVPAIFVYGHRTFPTPVPDLSGRDCSVDDKYKNLPLPVIYEGFFGVLFVLATVLLVSLYVRIWLETRRHRKYMKDHTMMGAILMDERSTSSVNANSSVETTGIRQNLTRETKSSASKTLLRKLLKCKHLNRKDMNGKEEEVKDGADEKLNSSELEFANNVGKCRTQKLSQEGERFKLDPSIQSIPGDCAALEHILSVDNDDGTMQIESIRSKPRCSSERDVKESPPYPPTLPHTKSSQSLYATRVKKALKARRTTVIAIAITIAFILSYLPHLTLAVLRSVKIDFEHHLGDFSLILYNIFLRSYFVNNAVNVFVYGTMNLEFRNQLTGALFRVKSACCRCRDY